MKLLSCLKKSLTNMDSWSFEEEYDFVNCYIDIVYCNLTNRHSMGFEKAKSYTVNSQSILTRTCRRFRRQHVMFAKCPILKKTVHNDRELSKSSTCFTTSIHIYVQMLCIDIPQYSSCVPNIFIDSLLLKIENQVVVSHFL